MRGRTAATCASWTRRARPIAAARMSSTSRRSSAGSRNFHKLPHTLLEVNNGLYNAVFRAALERAASSGSSTCRRRWCSSARPCSPRPRSTCTTAPRRAPRTASRSSPARCTAARCTTSTGCRTRSAGPSTPTGPGELPDAEPGIAHAVPDLIRKVLSGQRPLEIFGSGEQTRTLTHVDDIADGIVTAHGAPGRRERGLQHLGLRRADRRRDRARSSGRRAGGTRPSSSCEHLPSFEVDVQRRWPSRREGEAAARLGGARSTVGEGIADTVSGYASRRRWRG